MQDEYVVAFTNAVIETRNETGIEMPDYVEQYIILLLASRVRDQEFLPTTTFAETFFELQSKQQAKELGDHCLFITGMFPDYGISIDYYSLIGASSYDQASQIYNPELFGKLSRNFEYVRDFINRVKLKTR